MAISVLRHPFCTGQVAIECASCAIMLELWIDVQHDLRHLAPVRPLLIRIEHTQISNDVLFVVDREHGIRRCKIGNVWISRWFFHARVTKRMILSFCQPQRLSRLTLASFLNLSGGFADISLARNLLLSSPSDWFASDIRLVDEHHSFAALRYQKHNARRLKGSANPVARVLSHLKSVFGFKALQCR